MLIRRALIQATIDEYEYFVASSKTTFDLGQGRTSLTIREQMLDDCAILVILDNTLLDGAEKEKWLKANLGKNVWLRVTGTLELHSYVWGVYEREAGAPHKPMIDQILNLIAVEIISDHEMEMTTIRRD